MTKLKPAPDDEPTPHWAGNRYTWWHLLAVCGWFRGVVEFPEIGGWQCPRL